MQTLLEKIKEFKYEISQREEAIKVYKRGLIFLEEQRAYCEHEWNAPLKGFENEGCSCKLCGINDQYAPVFKKFVQNKNKDAIIAPY